MKYGLIILFHLSISFIHVASLRLVAQPRTVVGGETLVVWSKEPADAPAFAFDLCFVQSGKQVGLAAANVQVGDKDVYGTVSVNFSSPGSYSLTAVQRGERKADIGTSNVIDAVSVNPLPESTIQNTTVPEAPINSSIPSPPEPSESSSRTRSNRSKVPAIVGGVIGGLVFLALLFAMILFLWNRRRTELRPYNFHRESLVQRRPDQSDPSIPHLSVYQGAAAESFSQDLEANFSQIARIPASSIVVASPRGPRPPIKRPQAAHVTFGTVKRMSDDPFGVPGE